MVALVVVSTFLVLVLGVLVAGLLRSHADILRSLHDLGVGVGDPVAVTRQDTPPAIPLGGPALGPATTVAGVTPTGDARAVNVTNSDQLTLLGFLSSGCTSCAAFWQALQQPDGIGLPDATRIVIVTKGPELEIEAQVRTMATGTVPVVMSTDAWHDYQVPGSPFFVLVDGASGEKIGQGVASRVAQLVELVRRADVDRRSSARKGDRKRPAVTAAVRATGLDGPEREAAADDVLRAAGVHPGDPSLYPTSLEDVFPYADPERRAV